MSSASWVVAAPSRSPNNATARSSITLVRHAYSTATVLCTKNPSFSDEITLACLDAFLSKFKLYRTPLAPRMTTRAGGDPPNCSLGTADRASTMQRPGDSVCRWTVENRRQGIAG